MPMANINKSFVESVPFTKKGQKTYCDNKLSGFYLVVGMKAKTYKVQKDIRGKTTPYTLGRHGHLTADEARTLAKKNLYLMSQGIDPGKMEQEERGAVVTLDDVLKSYCETRKNISERTKQDYRYYMEKYLGDWMGRLMTDLDKDLIVARHALIGEKNGKRTANGTMCILRALFNHAEATFGICEVNPVTYLSKAKAWYPEKRRRTYIKPHQLKKWWKAVYALENDTMRDFLLLLLFTGLRRNEAATLKWADIDFNDKTFTIEHTKNHDPLTLPMSDFIYEMFERRRKRHGNGVYVFPGPGKDGHLSEPKKAIYRVIANSGIAFTCHDLRRGFATYAESLDLPYYALKQLLNHRSGDVTSGYIIVDTERLRGPVQKIADYILEQVK